MFKNAAKVQLIFCVCLISVFYSFCLLYTSDAADD